MAQPFLEHFIGQWEPDGRQHCANCVQAKVSGEPDDPMVRCAAGHGKVIELSRVIRTSRPMGMANGAECTEFDRA